MDGGEAGRGSCGAPPHFNSREVKKESGGRGGWGDGVGGNVPSASDCTPFGSVSVWTKFASLYVPTRADPTTSLPFSRSSLLIYLVDGSEAPSTHFVSEAPNNSSSTQLPESWKDSSPRASALRDTRRVPGMGVRDRSWYLTANKRGK